jgi:hypothetical protein
MYFSRNDFSGDRMFRLHLVWDPVCDRAGAVGVCNLHSSTAPVAPQLGRVFEDQVQMLRLDAGKGYMGKVSIIVLNPSYKQARR